MKRAAHPFKNAVTGVTTALFTATLALTSGCASMRSAFGLQPSSAERGPIHNPFGDFSPSKAEAAQSVVLRTKKGDRAVEVEFPGGSAQMTDLSIPMSPAFRDGGDRSPASTDPALGSPYRAKPPTMADHEITRAFPQTGLEHEGARREIEQSLGLMPAEEGTPDPQESYLGALDHLKALYKSGRFEAALFETDSLIRQYPTAPKLHQMRGTLLDRVGQPDLALKSWKQALQLEPQNASLRKFVERREKKRSLASP